MPSEQPQAEPTPITWTCDPPEFAAYVSRVDIIDRGDFVCIEIDMRCKRVPTHADERTTQDGASAGFLDIDFSPDVVLGGAVWPQHLGPWTGKRPTMTIAHGRTDLEVLGETQGRYSTRVLLMRRDLPREEVSMV